MFFAKLRNMLKRGMFKPEYVPTASLQAPLSQDDLYRLIADNTNEIVRFVDQSGIMLYVSPSHERILGHPPESLVGLPCTENLHKDDWSKIRNYLALAKYNPELPPIECRLQHRDGSWVLFEGRVVSFFNNRMQEDNFLFIAREITDRKRAEEAMAESEAKYRLIAENSLDLIRIVDQHDTILYASPSHETVLGYTPESLIGTRGGANLHPDDYAAAEQNFIKLLETKTPTIDEHRYRHKDGHYVDLEVQCIPLLSDSGEIDRVILVGRDISERKRTEELLREAEKLSVIGELAAGIAHEIRNPLTSIKGFIQLLREQSSGNQLYYSITLDELERINFIVSELLMLAKPQVKNYKPKNVCEIIDNVITLLDSQAIMNNVQITTHFEPDLPLIVCEENHLKQVFINVLKNGIEAIHHGGQITISVVKTDGEELLITFVDSGCGIPEELACKLGDPFYTTKDKGTGLGLMVSKKIIQDHKGRLEITSKLHVGTTVKIYLPIEHHPES
ncbi:PAS domain S-box protein [Brevibacillus sp. SYP-B805]|uniref:PAS domain-containing sensor histidine kinase n=1 Tax=Brevibacillus sp. SYP-B805 TaxID=1578199 RepID=UPI0013EC804D|nr:PAS domain-containing sensor histidine kinase [Brevibacillus sp. SYP-B805]NGQ97334.1 PAS domain S-box protein [Brevibacillus sp. SYP-B805]